MSYNKDSFLKIFSNSKSNLQRNSISSNKIENIFTELVELCDKFWTE